jgi:hypothetical protein
MITIIIIIWLILSYRMTRGSEITILILKLPPNEVVCAIEAACTPFLTVDVAVVRLRSCESKKKQRPAPK